MNTMRIYYDTNNEMQSFDYARYDYSNGNEHFVYTVTPKGINRYNVHHGDFVNQHNAYKKFLLLVDKSYTAEQIDVIIEISLNVFKYNKEGLEQWKN